MTKLSTVFQTAKDAYEAASNYYNELCDTIDGFIDLKSSIEMDMFFGKDTDYSSQMEECKKSIDLLYKVAKVFDPIVDELEQACKKLVENEELLRRGE